MTSSPPDRLSIDPRHPSYDADALRRGVRIRFNGVERRDVEEYSMSEKWIKVAAGRTRDRHGNPLLLTLKGDVEAFFDEAGPAEPEPDAQ
jgi:hypothetical protein